MPGPGHGPWQDRGVAFDQLDQRIVGALVENARATYSEIGERIGLSAPAVKRRVDRLRATGAITGFSAHVNPAALGWTTEAYVELFCRGRTSPADIGAAVSKYPEVTAAATITGEADALLHIRPRTCGTSSGWSSGSARSPSWSAPGASSCSPGW
jgi:DNA-binding Lrp family transcriptional regulator